MPSDLPRLVCGKAACESLLRHREMGITSGTVTVAERPMMVVGELPNMEQVPVPAGQRVEVGWRGIIMEPQPGWRDLWHPVATATVAYTPARRAIFGGVQRVDTDEWMVDLTDIEAVS